MALRQMMKSLGWIGQALNTKTGTLMNRAVHTVKKMVLQNLELAKQKLAYQLELKPVQRLNMMKLIKPNGMM
jgi:hypothetical protein